MTDTNWEELLRETQSGGRGWSGQLARGVEQRIERLEKSRSRTNAFKWAGGLTAAVALAAVVLIIGGPAMQGTLLGSDGQGGPEQMPQHPPVTTQPQEEQPDQPQDTVQLKHAKILDPVIAIEPAGRVQHKRFDSRMNDRMMEEWWDPQTQSYRVHQIEMNSYELNTIRIGSTMWVWNYNEKGELVTAEKVLVNPKEQWNRGWETLFDPFLNEADYENLGVTQFAGMPVEKLKYALDPTLAQKGITTYTMIDPKTRLPLAYVYEETGKPQQMDTYRYTYENDYEKIFTPPTTVTFTVKDLRHIPTPEEITEQNQNMSPDEQTDPTKWPKHSSEDD